jgi:hypothetical protein
MTAGIAITGDIGQSRALGGLHRTAAFDGGRVEEKKVVVCAGTLGAEDAEEPFDGPREAGSALVIGVLSRKNGEQMSDLTAGGPQEAPVRGDAHEHLGDGQGDDLGVARSAAGVPPPLWQKVIGCAINNGAEGVQVGVHRGLQADDVLDTVGFGPSASNPFTSAMFVASII